MFKSLSMGVLGSCRDERPAGSSHKARPGCLCFVILSVVADMLLFLETNRCDTFFGEGSRYHEPTSCQLAPPALRLYHSFHLLGVIRAFTACASSLVSRPLPFFRLHYQLPCSRTCLLSLHVLCAWGWDPIVSSLPKIREVTELSRT